MGLNSISQHLFNPIITVCYCTSIFRFFTKTVICYFLSALYHYYIFSLLRLCATSERTFFFSPSLLWKWFTNVTFLLQQIMSAWFSFLKWKKLCICSVFFISRVLLIENEISKQKSEYALRLTLVLLVLLLLQCHSADVGRVISDLYECKFIDKNHALRPQSS